MCRHTKDAPASVYERARQEANRHKWIESEKLGRDVGLVAIQEWSQRHFNRLVRWCRWLHLTGRQCFREFRCEQFGTVPDPKDPIAAQIVRQYWDGKENLEIYCSAHGCGWPSEQVFQLLMLLDINGTRLHPPDA